MVCVHARTEPTAATRQSAKELYIGPNLISVSLVEGDDDQGLIPGTHGLTDKLLKHWKAPRFAPPHNVAEAHVLRAVENTARQDAKRTSLRTRLAYLLGKASLESPADYERMAGLHCSSSSAARYELQANATFSSAHRLTCFCVTH